jgi:hypothetical protein
MSRSHSNFHLMDPESGGRSTLIFWLLHRLTNGGRQDFAFHDELGWVSKYGLLESVRKRKVGSDLADEDGAHIGNHRYRDQAHEISQLSLSDLSRRSLAL